MFLICIEWPNVFVWQFCDEVKFNFTIIANQKQREMHSKRIAILSRNTFMMRFYFYCQYSEAISIEHSLNLINYREERCFLRGTWYTYLNGVVPCAIKR